MKQIAVIGAGVCGSLVARFLVDRGRAVRVFDKGRGPGGRASTRRLESGHGFDHGVPWFAASSPAFVERVRQWGRDGRVRSISVDGRSLYCGTNGISKVCREMLGDIPAEFGVRIDKLTPSADGIELADTAGRSFGRFDRVVSTVPASQALDLAPLDEADLRDQLRAVVMEPRWVVMLAFERRLAIEGHLLHGKLDGCEDVQLTRSLSNTVGDAWVVRPGPRWSDDFLEASPPLITERLVAVARQTLADAWQPPLHASPHRWRFALTRTPARGVLASRDGRLIFAGDWAVGSDVEAAFTSAHFAAALPA